MNLSVRWRLTLWFAASALILLLLLAAAVFVLEQSSLERQARMELAEDLRVLRSEIARDPTGLDEPERAGLAEAYAVWDADRPLHLSSGWLHFGLDESPPADGRHRLHDRVIRVQSGPVPEAGAGGPRLRIAVAHDETLTVRAIDMLGVLLAAAIPLAVIGALAMGWSVAGRALAPTRILRRDLERIEAERLHERITAGRPGDEFGRVAAVINAMLGRLERSMEARRRFAADASHQLRTPLASLRAVGEAALRRHPDDPEALREVIGSMLEECDRLGRLTTGLLELTRGEQVAITRSSVALPPLLEQVAEQLAPLVEAADMQLTVAKPASPEGSPPPVTARAAAEPIRRAVLGLIENVLVHCDPGTRIELAAEAGPDGPSVTVRDDGPGIPAAERSRIFEPFVRGTDALERPGCGLGLALARTAVASIGGRLLLEDGPGTRFRIILQPDGSEP